MANIQDLGIVKDLMVEAEDLLVLAIHGNRSHFCRRKMEDVLVKVDMTDCRPSKLEGVEKMSGCFLSCGKRV